MKRTLTIAALIVIALAYVAGFWPERQRRIEAQTELQAMQARLVAAEARLRLGEVLGQLLRLSDAIDVRNFGEATALSSAFFDSVRSEAARADRAETQSALQDILTRRDQVTTEIAGTDPSLSVTLKQFEQSLRQALAYPVSAP